MASFITFTSDYGITDPYAAAVKGTIYSELQDARITDITHNIEPGNFYEAAFIIRNCYASFPKGTVHLVAVKELTEVQRFLAIALDGHYFLCADNGLAGLINPDLKISRVVEINFKQEFTLFPARDVLARAACHLARNGTIDILGRQIEEYQKSAIMRPRISNDGSTILGSVVYVDNFGNLITNISLKKFKEVGKERKFEIALPRNQSLSKIQRNYYPSAPGSLLALFNSQNLLEIAISGSRGKNYNGANTLLGINVQDSITINFT